MLGTKNLVRCVGLGKTSGLRMMVTQSWFSTNKGTEFGIKTGATARLVIHPLFFQLFHCCLLLMLIYGKLREMVFRGVTSTAMIYDEKPIFDHFRYVDENIVAGAMDCPKVFGSESTYYFYLTRLE